jgi:hypothetical protein
VSGLGNGFGRIEGRFGGVKLDSGGRSGGVVLPPLSN